MPIIRLKTFLLLCFSTLLFMAPQLVAAKELWYTIQVGSYAHKNDAKAYYNTIYNKLPKSYKSNLRIEYISSYYAVRVGKSKSSRDILPLFEITKTLSDQPLIMYAYIRQARIIWPNHKTLPTNPPTFNQSPGHKDIIIKKEEPLSADGLVYTVQTGSFLKKDSAIRLYNTLSKKLPSGMRTFLRIEKIAAFYTVRLGKSVRRKGVSGLKREAGKLVNNPVILKAYIKKERLITSFQPPPITSITNKPKSRTNIPTKSQPEPKDIKPPTAKPAIKTLRKPSIQPKANTKLQKKIPPPPADPPKKTLTSQEYEKILISKYLDNSTTTKNRQAATKKSKLFTATPDCTTATCHQILQKSTVTHSPVQQTKCLACHKQLNKQHPNDNDIDHDFQLVKNGAALCQQCHVSIIQGEIRHDPAEQGECLQCHNPHGSENQFLLSVSKENEQDLCLECHDSKLIEHRYLHGPVGLGICTFCHNPHSSSQSFLLRDEPKKLCETCHSEFKEGLHNSPYIHTPVKNKACQFCHAAHGSEYPNLLTSDPSVFCFSCHPDIQKKFDKSRVKHSGLYLDQQCGTCHLGHYSSNQSLLIYEEKELCLTCHGNNSTMKSYSPKNIEKEISNKEYIHAPVDQGKCSSCHDPHGSQFDSLLIAKYPSTFYAPYDPDLYDLCFTCHDKELLTATTTPDKTQFRNGSRNLHFVHVGIERKGRTCNACHNPHASDGPKLINRTGAKFGEWTMSIDFNLTETGGSCMPGCHRRMKYDRVNPVVRKATNKIFEKYYIDYKSPN